MPDPVSRPVAPCGRQRADGSARKRPAPSTRSATGSSPAPAAAHHRLPTGGASLAHRGPLPPPAPVRQLSSSEPRRRGPAESLGRSHQRSVHHHAARPQASRRPPESDFQCRTSGSPAAVVGGTAGSGAVQISLGRHQPGRDRVDDHSVLGSLTSQTTARCLPPPGDFATKPVSPTAVAAGIVTDAAPVYRHRLIQHRAVACAGAGHRPRYSGRRHRRPDWSGWASPCDGHRFGDR
jgi:hypothetical protein